MRLTQEADYALRIVYTLAKAGDTLDARSVSELACVPERFTVKILRKLVLCGTVNSKKGSAGGYLLASPPQNITMRQVVEAIEGSLEISRCLGGDYECSRNYDKKGCTFHLIFEKLNAGLAEKLDKITIAEDAYDSVSFESILNKI